MANRGMETKALWLERGLFLPSPEEVDALGLEAGASVSRLAPFTDCRWAANGH